MAKFHRPEPGISEAISAGMAAARSPDTPPINPYSYGTPCYWTWRGAYIAMVVSSRG